MGNNLFSIRSDRKGNYALNNSSGDACIRWRENVFDKPLLNTERKDKNYPAVGNKL
jgi:hypothetical protein